MARTQDSGTHAWIAGLRRFEAPDTRKVIIQLADTVLPYLGLTALMLLTVKWGLPYWITLVLAIPTGALLLRMFIFFHDCCHGSYLQSPVALNVLGRILGVLTFTPFDDWRHSHGIHHSTSGNLDKRGVGDVWTMTLAEYEQSGRFQRALYRFYRYPAVMFFLGPILSFVIMNRIPSRGATRKGIVSVILTNVGIAGIILAVGFTLGFWSYLKVELPVLLIGGAAGVWLFYVQHQFDPSYWARNGEWESTSAAMLGSSYYKLPKVLQWISASIGLHHVHHLRPRIPNYHLQACVEETPQLQLPNSLTLRSSLRSIRYNVWDEERKTLLSFREMKQVLRQRLRPA
ncbi:MAG TPA: fatty acid desaturase [Spirochaetia bacterium]|nr:fatty acid desaturase [Spirochaetia bacterium]